MNTRYERPIRDRPLEVAAGLTFAAAGITMLASMIFTGSPNFAPRYLREAADWIVVLYATLALAGGLLILHGLRGQAYGDPIIGRWEEAIGHILIAGIGTTYAWDLTLGGFSAPGNTLLLAFLFGHMIGSTMRAIVQIRRNFLAVRVVSEAVAEQENGDHGPRNA